MVVFFTTRLRKFKLRVRKLNIHLFGDPATLGAKCLLAKVTRLR